MGQRAGAPGRRFLKAPGTIAASAIVLGGVLCAGPALHAGLPPGDQAGAAAEKDEEPGCGPGFHLAPWGDDAADGSRERPFATPGRASAAMRAGPWRVTCVVGGRYELVEPLLLGADASNTAFVAAAGESPVLDWRRAGLTNPVVLDGATGVTLQGLGFAGWGGEAMIRLAGGGGHALVGNMVEGAGTGVVLDGSRGNRVVGNVLRNSVRTAVEAKDGSDDNVFADNMVDGAGAPATHGGGFFLHGASRNVIRGNTVRNTAGMGIGIVNWGATTINVGNVVSGNLVRNVNMSSQDSGAIYVLGRSHVDTRTEIVGNVVDNAGPPGEMHTIGIYLDDSASGVSVRGNVVRNGGTHAVQVHGGDDIEIACNVFDLGAAATSAVLIQEAPADTMPTNTMRNIRVAFNVVSGRGSGQELLTVLSGPRPEALGNLVWGVGGSGNVRSEAWGCSTAPRE